MPTPLLCTLKGNFDVKWFKPTKKYMYVWVWNGFQSATRTYKPNKCGVDALWYDMIYLCVCVCVWCDTDTLQKIGLIYSISMKKRKKTHEKMPVFKFNSFTYIASLNIIFSPHTHNVSVSLSLLLLHTHTRHPSRAVFFAPTIIIMFERICTRSEISHKPLDVVYGFFV